MVRSHRTNFMDARDKIDLSRAAKYIARKLTARNQFRRFGNANLNVPQSSRKLNFNPRNRYFESVKPKSLISLTKRSARKFDNRPVPNRTPFRNQQRNENRLITNRNRGNALQLNDFRDLRAPMRINPGFTRTVYNDLQQPNPTKLNARVRLNRPNQSINRSDNRSNADSNGKSFLKALQQAETSRHEARESLAKKSYSTPSVFDRLSTAPTAAKSIPKGYKLVVTNLSATVSDDDVKELFGCMGALIESRLVKQGHAYAIFKRVEDAKKALTEFNNRELDGVPMKITLVNANLDKINRLETPNIARQPEKIVRALNLAKNAQKIVEPMDVDQNPILELDQDLISRALFSDSSSSSKRSSNVQFTVKI